jgi:hypothetical protein
MKLPVNELLAAETSPEGSIATTSMVSVPTGRKTVWERTPPEIWFPRMSLSGPLSAPLMNIS